MTGFSSWWSTLIAEVVAELASPTSAARKREMLDRSMVVERERLIRQIEVSEGRRSSVWGDRR